MKLRSWEDGREMSNDKLQMSNQILIPNAKLMYKILILIVVARLDTVYLSCKLTPEVRMKKERRKKSEKRKKERRKLLTEDEFRKMINTGKTSKGDKRSWTKRRKTKRRKRQVGV